jgi:hypothetical protein
MAAPGDCSPSRKVVSNTIKWLFITDFQIALQVRTSGLVAVKQPAPMTVLVQRPAFLGVRAESAVEAGRQTFRSRSASSSERREIAAEEEPRWLLLDCMIQEL